MRCYPNLPDINLVKESSTVGKTVKNFRTNTLPSKKKALLAILAICKVTKWYICALLPQPDEFGKISQCEQMTAKQ